MVPVLQGSQKETNHSDAFPHFQSTPGISAVIQPSQRGSRDPLGAVPAQAHAGGHRWGGGLCLSGEKRVAERAKRVWV